jgi:hypothetical protein
VICRVACAASSRVLLRCENIRSHSTAAGMALRVVVIELFELYVSFSRPEEPCPLRAPNSSSVSISPRLNLVPNERSIASLPDTGVSIQFVPFTLARSSSGALSLNGAVGLAHSPGQNLRGAKCPHQGRGSHESLIRATIAFGPSLLSVLTIPQAPTPALLSPTSSTPKGAVFEGWARPLPQFSRFPPVQSGDGSHSPASRTLFSI